MTLGWHRLQGVYTSIPPGFEAYSAWIKADTCVPTQIDAIENELDAVRVSGEETIHAEPFGNLPVIILSHDPTKLHPPMSAPSGKATNVVWDQMQEEAKGLSSQSRRNIAKGSDHNIQRDRSDLLIQEHTSFGAMIRNHQSYSDNQSTTEE